MLFTNPSKEVFFTGNTSKEMLFTDPSKEVLFTDNTSKEMFFTDPSKEVLFTGNPSKEVHFSILNPSKEVLLTDNAAPGSPSSELSDFGVKISFKVKIERGASGADRNNNDSESSDEEVCRLLTPRRSQNMTSSREAGKGAVTPGIVRFGSPKSFRKEVYTLLRRLSSNNEEGRTTAKRFKPEVEDRTTWPCLSSDEMHFELSAVDENRTAHLRPYLNFDKMQVRAAIYYDNLC